MKTKMLKEQYARLFKGKPMSNDASLINEAAIKVTRHNKNFKNVLVFSLKAKGKEFWVTTGSPDYNEWEYYQKTGMHEPDIKVSPSAIASNPKDVFAAIEKYVKDNEKEIDQKYGMGSYTGKKASASSGISIPGIDIKDFRDAVETIADGAGGGENMTDDIVDELGDFYDGVYDSNNQKLIDAYDDLRSTVDGEPNDQAEAANKLLNVIG